MKRSSFLFFIALFCLALVLADLYLWFSVTSDTSSHQQYLSHYPEPLRNMRLLTVFSILLLTFSGFLFLNASGSRPLKVVASLLALLAAIMIIWKIFSFTHA